MTQRYQERYAPARIAQSKLTQVTAANRNVIDQTSVRYFADLVEGSKALCAAILRTRKLHGPMTTEQQIDAVKYAHDITHDVILPRTKQRTVIWGDVK
jgi:hypothetical protein